MKRTVSAMEARKRLGELLESVYYRGDEVVIERAGKVMGVVIPESRYRVLEDGRDRIIELIERLHEHNRQYSDEEIEAEIDAAIGEVRIERRATG